MSLEPNKKEPDFFKLMLIWHTKEGKVRYFTPIVNKNNKMMLSDVGNNFLDDKNIGKNKLAWCWLKNLQTKYPN